MAEAVVQRYKIADYLKVGATYELMSVFTQIDENPTAQVDEVHYTCKKTSTKNTKGYAPVFPISGNMYQNNRVAEYLRDIGQEQKTGADCETEYIRVDLYRLVATNTYYARKFKVSVEISGISGAGGENLVLAGNLNSIDDVDVGTFNTATKTFTSGDILESLSVASVAGSTAGDTRIIVLPTLASGNSYVSKTAASVTMPTYGQVLTSGWTAWDGVADITATTGHEIVIAEVDGTTKAVKAGKATVVSATE